MQREFASYALAIAVTPWKSDAAEELKIRP